MISIIGAWQTYFVLPTDASVSEDWMSCVVESRTKQLKGYWD